MVPGERRPASEGGEDLEYLLAGPRDELNDWALGDCTNLCTLSDIGHTGKTPKRCPGSELRRIRDIGSEEQAGEGRQRSAGSKTRVKFVFGAGVRSMLEPQQAV